MSSMITSEYFRDVLVHILLPNLPKQVYHSLCCVSKTLCRYLAIHAETDKTYFSLSGKTLTAKFDDDTSPISYLRFKTRKHVLANSPQLMITLNEPRKSITNPEELQSWIDYINTHQDTHLPPAAVLFDFDKPLLTAQGNCSLGDALNREVWESPPNIALIKAILSSHPNSDTILGVGMFGLGRALSSAIFRAQSIEIVKEIFKHKNAKDIPAKGIFSLSSGILNAIDVKNGAAMVMVGEILKHPNAKKIPQDGHYGYLNCIKKAEKENANEIHDLLMNTFCPIQPSSSKTPMDN